ncbi:polysaccharide deacetylase [Acidobacteria bacterium AB60]|nr:polysaccharide deacetylase [Acidobacteria bacterium AB60]
MQTLPLRFVATAQRAARALLVLASLLVASALGRAQQIAFTWDDVPAHSAMPPGETRVAIAQKLIAAMKDAGLPPVYGFVNGVAVEREPASERVFKIWRDAGLFLGNHAWSHMNLNTATLADWEADVLKNEPLLEKAAAGTDWHWLRYPFLAEGDTPEKRLAARKFLADHNYKIAAVTMSFGDYMWNEPYARCSAKNDTAAIAQLETSYLDAAAADADFRRAMARALFGHDIPYVLLMHVGAFDARMLPRLLALYKSKGFHFVTLQEGEKDPFYKGSMNPALDLPPDTLESAMHAKGLPLPSHPRPNIDVNSLCR